MDRRIGRPARRRIDNGDKCRWQNGRQETFFWGGGGCKLRVNFALFLVLLVAIRTMQLHLRVNGSESVGEHFVENILRNSKPLINY